MLRKTTENGVTFLRKFEKNSLTILGPIKFSFLAGGKTLSFACREHENFDWGDSQRVLFIFF